MSLVAYGLAAAVVVTVGGLYIFREKLGLTGKANSEVMLTRPRDKRFNDIKIIKETDQSLEAPREKGITRFFIKKYTGWVNKKGKTRFIGLEGVDFTLTLKGKIQEVISLADAIKIVLGEEIWAKIDPHSRESLEAAKFGITTEPIIDENIGRNQGNENVFTESDKAMIKYHAEENAKAARSGKIEWMPVLLGLFAGVIVGVMLVSYKVIRIG